MKALVLAGGSGTRLRPITHTNAKQLIPIANKPILFYGLEAIREAGIKNVGIVVGDTENEIKEAVGNGSRLGLKVSYIRQEAPLGLAHAVKVSRAYMGQEPFVMYLGDNLIQSGISSFVRAFEKNRPNAQILLARVPHPEQFGVAELRGDRVVRLVEKPKHPRSNLALVGVYMFDKTIFAAVNHLKPSKRGELEITDAIQYLIDCKRLVASHIITGWWKDTGKLEDMLEANRLMLETLEPRIAGRVDKASRIEGKVVIEKGARIEKSALRGPVIIGERSRIVSSYIGPFTSIYHDVLIRASEVEHSIILENSSIEDLKPVEDSLIGTNVRILKSSAKPSAYRLMLGDSSRIEVL